ncbi:MAG TPA: type II toxin-antitoxin system MqsA family antitoxin [Acidimicrobiales bacterium]|nr:type II toxin-antitoxin system MqsA family antitoxin [Acidimicrobiales bacterium]
MSCPLCRNGELRAGRADTSILREGLVLVVRDVPAEICDNCGEQFFDADVTDRLLDIADEAAQAGVFVDVRRYVAA